MMPAFHIFAPAKINLFLHITGKRADGYHLLQSLMGFANVGDDLSFAGHDAFIIETTGPFAAALPETGDNLIVRAARLLAAAYAVPCRGKITLTKNLPVASGIGGGSADAAAALRGLARLWALPEDLPRLEKIGLQLGADVPACVASRAVYAAGIGDVLTAADMPKLHLVLVNPLAPVPTAAVFARFQGGVGAAGDVVQNAMMDSPAAFSMDFLFAARNDLTDAAVSVLPVIRAVLDAIAGTQACQFSRLSGSGATCFGLYAKAEEALAAALALAAAHPAWWVRAADV